MEIWPGKPYPLGATWDGAGVNFALFSENATGVELCLFNGPEGQWEVLRLPMREPTDQVWHSYLPEIRPGHHYGYRVHGPYVPQDGHRFNPAKLLLDPYAKAIAGTIRWSDALFGYTIGHPETDLSQDPRDNAPGLPKCVVVDPAFSWGDDTPPRIPWHQTIIYELHVKGFTVQHPAVPPGLQGTYAGLTCPPVLAYLRSLGITAAELMPVHQFVADNHLVDRGLTNYWGYNTIGFFAPRPRYASSGVVGQQVAEFKTLVKTLHREGIEVILDVVYNHTAEGNHLGPTLCFRGIDNAAYYRLVADHHRYYTSSAFFQGRAIRGSAVKDLTWFRPDGKEMTEEDWVNPGARCFGLRLVGDTIEEVDERGGRIVGDTLLILLNAYWEPLAFILPAHRPKLRWQLLLDTREAARRQRSRLVRGGRPYELAARSLALFRLHALHG